MTQDPAGAPVWQRYMTDYNEGLGVVYERFVLNDYLDGLVDRYGIRTVLEAPLYGMAGVSGINSVRLAQRGLVYPYELVRMLTPISFASRMASV